MTQLTNPLKAFFRQPAIYLKLPSNGSFWPEDSVDFPHNRELPVYPMTAAAHKTDTTTWVPNGTVQFSTVLNGTEQSSTVLF